MAMTMLAESGIQALSSGWGAEGHLYPLV